MNDVTSLGPAAMLVILLNILGLMLKKSPILDWKIPWALVIVGAIAYPFLGDPSSSIAYRAIIGIVIAGQAIANNQLYRQTTVGRAEDNAADSAPPGPNIKLGLILFLPLLILLTACKTTVVDQTLANGGKLHVRDTRWFWVTQAKVDAEANPTNGITKFNLDATSSPDVATAEAIARGITEGLLKSRPALVP